MFIGVQTCSTWIDYYSWNNVKISPPFCLVSHHLCFTRCLHNPRSQPHMNSYTCCRHTFAKIIEKIKNRPLSTLPTINCLYVFKSFQLYGKFLYSMVVCVFSWQRNINGFTAYTSNRTSSDLQLIYKRYIKWFTWDTYKDNQWRYC